LWEFNFNFKSDLVCFFSVAVTNTTGTAVASFKEKMPGSSGSRAEHWCFTMNNHTPADADRLAKPIPGVEHLIFGREAGASGAPHLQGTVCFQSRLASHC